MAATTSLVRIASQMQVTAFQTASACGVVSVFFSALWNQREHPVQVILIWATTLLALATGTVIMIRSNNMLMRTYALRRGALPNTYGLEAEIIPFVDVLTFFLGVSTYVLIGGIYLFVVTEMQKWGIVFCAGIALLISAISALYHRRFVKHIEEALDAEEDGWRTFHRWSQDTFKELL